MFNALGVVEMSSGAVEICPAADDQYPHAAPLPSKLEHQAAPSVPRAHASKVLKPVPTAAAPAPLVTAFTPAGLIAYGPSSMRPDMYQRVPSGASVNTKMY